MPERFLFGSSMSTSEITHWLNEAVGLSIPLGSGWMRIIKVLEWQVLQDQNSVGYHDLIVRVEYVEEESEDLGVPGDE